MSITGKITLSAVRELQPGDEMRDSELRGFGVRRQSSTISYFVHTRINGRLKRLTIGRHGSPWTPEMARKEAARLLVGIRAGENPAAERDARRHVTAPFEVVAAEFMRVHGPRLKPKSSAMYESLIRLQLTPIFKGKPIADITAAQVTRAHASWSGTPRTANFAVAVPQPIERRRLAPSHWRSSLPSCTARPVCRVTTPLQTDLPTDASPEAGAQAPTRKQHARAAALRRPARLAPLARRR
ncbi:MAG: integrase arm-type DNA-binding domain-containing protein [Hyphomicrobiaceae bacterium]|nr:integrase arm-type DNA-binding domain-containing protein [Hyphomicrobiaceae bacterium]